LLRSILMAVLPDVFAQQQMVNAHHRTHFDRGEAFQAGQMSLVGGLIALGLGRYGGDLAGGLTDRFGAVGGPLANAALHGAATNVATNITVGMIDQAETAIFDPKNPGTQATFAGQVTGENMLLAALSGAATGMLFAGAGMVHDHPFTTFVPQ